MTIRSPVISTTEPTLRISDDGLVAALCIPAAAARRWDAERLVELLQAHDIVVDEQVRDALEAMRCRALTGKDAADVVARGRAPIAGSPGRLRWESDFDPDLTHCVDIAEDGSINWYEQTPFVTADAGAHLATVLPPQPGCEGCDVFGRPIAPPPVEPYLLRTDASVEVEPDGRVISRRAGLMCFAGGEISVQPVMDIPGHVDFSTGNLRFDGAVIIRGDINDLFQVHCTDRLDVVGVIGSAQVTCTRMLRALGGINGRSTGCVEVAGSIIAKYVSAAKVRCEGRLVAGREMIHCDAVVHRSVEIPRGSIIGGTLVAGGQVRVGTVGSLAGVVTTFRLGYVPRVTEALNELQLAMSTLSTRLKQVRRMQRTPGTENDAEAPTADADALTSCGGHLQHQQNEAMRSFDDLRREFRQRCVAQLTVTRMLYPGVTIYMPQLRIDVIAPLEGPIVFAGSPDGRLQVTRGGKPFDAAEFLRVATTVHW